MAGKIIYFVRSERSGLIKIGLTAYDHPQYRYKDLCREHGEELTRLGITYGDHKAEAAIHDRFAEMRDHGEWFRAEASLLDFIRDHLEPWPPKPERRKGSGRKPGMRNQPKAVHRRSYRWTDEEVEVFKQLADAWGGIRPLSESDVIREAARRCLAASAKKARKKAPSVS